MTTKPNIFEVVSETETISRPSRYSRKIKIISALIGTCVSVNDISSLLFLVLEQFNFFLAGTVIYGSSPRYSFDYTSKSY